MGKLPILKALKDTEHINMSVHEHSLDVLITFYQNTDNIRQELVVRNNNDDITC